MLEGKTVNLRIMEKEDLPLFAKWMNSGEWTSSGSINQYSPAQWEQLLNSTVFKTQVFVIEKKDGNRIGYIWHWVMIAPYMDMRELGYGIIANERRKGYGTEAAQLMVDYLFLTKNVARIQATTHTENVLSQRVLEKVGFKKEGTLRKPFFTNGEWTDLLLFSILREEWKQPHILTRTT